MIFDGPLGEIESSFDTVVIPLDGRMNSSLQWKEVVDAANKAVEKGISILWEIDFGLFTEKEFPLDNEMQFKAFGLALSHFSDTLWTKYEEQSKGIILYRGPIDFRSAFSGEKRDLLESRTICIDYLDHLVHFLPTTCPSFVLLDASMIDCPAECALLLDSSCYSRVDYAVKNSLIPYRGVIWGKTRSQALPDQGYIGCQPPSWDNVKEPSIAICLASEESINQQLKDAIEYLKEKNTPYRMISEENLITEWDSLDYLIVTSDKISHEFKRKLLGFCAAGGTVVNCTGQPIGLPQEISLLTLEI